MTSAPDPDPAAPARSGSGETDAIKARREVVAKLKAIVVVVALTAGVLFFLSTRHPSVEASVDASLPAPLTPVVLHGARVVKPIEARLASFSAEWGVPSGEPVIPSREERIELLIPISARSCPEVVAEIGGSCSGVPKPPLWSLDQLKIQATGRPFRVRVTPQRAPKLQLTQNSEATHRGTPSSWTLAENASATKVQFECDRGTALTVSLLPGQASPPCSLTGSYYRLLITNDQPSAPTFAFSQVLGFEGTIDSVRAKIGIDSGRVSINGDDDRISGSDATSIVLDPTDSESVRLKVTAPIANRVGDTSLHSTASAHVLVGDDDRVPSLLSQSKEVTLLWVGLLAGVFLDSIIVLIGIRRS